MKLKEALKFDKLLLVSVLLLVITGIVFVYSASMYSAEQSYGDKFFFMRKQIIGALIGSVALAFCTLIKIDIIKKLSPWLLLVSYVLLALVFVPGIGIENYGAKRWIGFGSFSFQPSEIAKFALVCFSATFLSRQKFVGRKFTDYLPIAAVGAISCALIIAEPNMSVTVCVAVVIVIMMFIGGAGLKGFAVTLIGGITALPVLIVVEPYRLKRLIAFIDPFASPKDEGYQLIQSLYALGSGGWFGVGLFNSRQKYKFLPFAESDFIFSVIGEEIGLVGAIAVIALFGIVVWRGTRIAVNAKSRFEKLLAGGITAVIAVQTLINLAVVTGSIPPTGIPLPLISYGGTSLVVFMSAVGLLLNISKGSNYNSLMQREIFTKKW